MGEEQNIYKKCRLAAAERDPRLKIREEAARILLVSTESLGNYERGDIKKVPPEVIDRMATVYNAPELRLHYCVNECPLGKDFNPNFELQEIDIDRLTLKLLNSFRSITAVRESLIEIAADGVIDNDEQEKLEAILETLNSISRHTQELRIWAKKRFSTGM